MLIFINKYMSENYINENSDIKLIPVHNGYKFVNNYSVILSKTQVKKNMKVIKNNIDALEKNLKELQSGKEFESQKKKLDTERKNLKKFFENFDQDYDNHIEELIKNKEKERDALKERILKIDKEHEKILSNVATRLINKLDQVSEELEDNKKSYELYKNAIK